MDSKSNVEDLQAVSQHILVCSERIKVLEQEKRTIDPASEQFRTLSDEIEALADEIRSVSHAETGLAREVSDETDLPTVAEADRARS